MSSPPSELSDEDIAEVVTILRGHRERFVAAKAEAKAAGKKVKPPKVNVDLSSLGLK